MSIEILNNFPIVLTKDAAWAKRELAREMTPGTIVVLPPDAVLVDVESLPKQDMTVRSTVAPERTVNDILEEAP